MRALEPVLLGRSVLLGGDGMPTEARAPATITDFVRVDEVIRRFTAFGTFERHRPRHSANVQAMCTGSQLNPLAEFCCRVPLVQLVRLLTCEEKRPRTKEDHQPCCYYDSHKQYDHMKTLPAFNSFCGVNSSVLHKGEAAVLLVWMLIDYYRADQRWSISHILLPGNRFPDTEILARNLVPTPRTRRRTTQNPQLSMQMHFLILREIMPTL